VVLVCDNSYTWIDGITYVSSNNTATFTITNAVGCDSIVTLNLTIGNSTTGVDNITACDSYTWIDGVTYTASNNSATHTLTNSVGCDSIVTLNLMLNNSTTGVDVITACDSYTWIDGITYTASNNTATHILTNSIGCDSIVTLNLTIINSTTGTDVITACYSYTWIDGVTYTASNSTATHTLTNSIGCDSIVTLNLTINNTTTGTDVITACDSYTWIDGVTYTASNNSATQTLTNAMGCDSVVTLDLTISTIDVSVMQNSPMLTANNSTATYQWIDCNAGNAPIFGETGQSFIATVNGNYAVIIDEGSCSDTSACYAINDVSVPEHDYEIKLYPNPTTNIVVLEMASQGSIRIYSMDGQLVSEYKYYSGVNELFFELVPGMYLVQVVDEEKGVGKQILVVR